MKKLFSSIAIIAILFVSCKKYEASESIDLNNLPKVTVSVSVFANLDETNTIMEAVPDDNRLVSISVPYNQYGGVANGNHVIYAKEVRLEKAADSKSDIRTFYFDVPVLSTGVNATISFEDFTHNVKTRIAATGEEITVLRRFTCAPQVMNGLSQSAGEHRNIALQYAAVDVNPNDSQLLAPTHTVNVLGEIRYQSDDTATIWTRIPDNTEITAIITLTTPDGRTYRESQQINTIAGIYNITVPMIERGVATIDLHAENFWTFTNISTNQRAIWRYGLTQTIGGIYNYPVQSNKNYTYTRLNHVQDMQ